MSFESELAKGRFCIPKCNVCEKTVWPPAEFCSQCMGDITLKKEDFEGKIVEFSKQGEDYFCIVEFEGARMMAKILKTPKIDQRVKISKCGIADGDYFFCVS